MIVALVGMPGSGKTTSAKMLESKGGFVIRFGDITEEILKEKGLEVNEQNERMIRESIRKEYGMDAYAKLNKNKIDEALKKYPFVVIDGLYSWEEYLFMRENYDEFVVVHIYASPKTRYARLSSRDYRALTPEEAWNRDKAEIEKLNKAGPIAMADYVIINEKDISSLEKSVVEFYEKVVKK